MSKGTVNKVILVGRLGADPDIRYSASGVAVAQFNLATNERVQAGEGNWEDRTEWHRIVTFGRTAEFCGNYLSKGRLVFIEGSLQTRQWEDKQGIKRYTTEIVARDLQLLGSADEQSRQGGQGRMSPPSERTAESRSMGSRPVAEELPPPSDAPDEDIPF